MFWVLAAFVFGSAWGSFLNVLVERYDPASERLNASGRSYCPSCKKTLRWFELVPIASFIFLRGRCARCGARIPIRYLWVELFSGGALALFTFLHSGGSLMLFATHGVTCSLMDVACVGIVAVRAICILFMVALFVFDMRHFILPDVLTVSGAALALLSVLAFQPNGMLNFLLSGLLAALFFAILYTVTRGRWLGFGDVKLVAFIGFAFGYPLTFVVIAFAIWAGAIAGITLVALGYATMRTKIPLGVFLAAASIAVFIFDLRFVLAGNAFW